MQKNADWVIANLQVHTESGLLSNAAVTVKGKLIHSIGSTEQVVGYDNVLSYPSNYHLVPGFIDMHVHGANGSDVMDATLDALANMSSALAQEGTTSFLATTMTASLDEIENALCAVSQYRDVQKSYLGAKILGVHLEGPFLSPKKVGAQRADQILAPKIAYIEHWQKMAKDVIKLVTLAPELPNSLEFIRALREKNIIAAIGHTDALYAESRAAIAAGCTHATHLFNAMRGIHQREPGPIPAILESDQVMAELILDKVHLHPSIVQMVLRFKGAQNLVLVTDAMRAKCLQAGEYDLGGQVVTVKDAVARLADGTLAGSVLKMNSAVRNFMDFTGCELSVALKCAAENPARALNVFSDKGSISVGKHADLVVLDDQFNVVLTVAEGRVVYQK